MLEADLKTVSDACVLSLSGELDLAERAKVDKLVTRILAGSFAGVVVDISTISYLDSAGIEILIILFKKLSDDEVPLAFVTGQNAYAVGKLDELGLSHVPGFKTFATVEDALATMRKDEA